MTSDGIDLTPEGYRQAAAAIEKELDMNAMHGRWT